MQLVLFCWLWFGGVVPQSSAGKLEMTWTMKRDGKRLRIDYTVRNGTAARVVLVDQLPVENVIDRNAIIVKNADAPNTIAFVRALVKTDDDPLELPFPEGRILAAGATLKGTAYTAWPLRSWHNFGDLPALKTGATQAVLDIGYIEEPFTIDKDGVPNAFARQKLLRGKPQRLPK